MKSKLIAIGALAAVAAVAPATTASAHIDVAVKSVEAHTTSANSALARAVSLFNQNADRRGSRAFGLSRSELRGANAEAAKLRRTAKTRNQRADAARARVLVANQQNKNIERSVAVLGDVSGRVENTIAKAALADTRGRTKAIAIITALINGDDVSDNAAKGLARALAALSIDRVNEVRVQARGLTGDDVGRSGKVTLAHTVKANVEGQTKAAAKLAALIADTTMPAESKPGLQRAYDAVIAEHGSIADILSRLSDRMPAEIRSYVEPIITQVRDDAQTMRESRPTPPAHPGPGGPPFAS